MAGVVGGWEAGSPVGDKEASQCQGRPDPCLGGAVKCSLSWEGKLAQPPCWFPLPPGGRRQPRGEWGGARGLVSSLCPAPADRGPLRWARPSPVSCMASLHLPPFLGFASFRTSHHALLGRLNPDLPALRSPSPSPARFPLALGRQEPRATGWGCLGKELLGLAPPPSLHTCLRPGPAPQGSHLARVLSFPGCKLPPTAPWHLLRFRLHELFLLGSSGQAGVSPPFVCLRV